MQQNSTSLQSK